MIFLGVGRDARDYFSAENLVVGVKLMVANVVTPAETHYLEPSSSHCDLDGTFDCEKEYVLK